MTAVKKINPDDPNVRDPKHAHELGGTLGMTVGGIAGGIAAGTGAVAAAAATGAMAGAVAGPIGVVAGAAIGGAIGGALGEKTARAVNPTAEEEYWKEHYHTRPYVTVKEYGFDMYRPAYRSGIDAYSKNPNQNFDSVEPALRREWLNARGDSELEWEEASPAARDAFERLSTPKTLR